jgi:hypothetical protein
MPRDGPSRRSWPASASCWGHGLSSTATLLLKCGRVGSAGSAVRAVGNLGVVHRGLVRQWSRPNAIGSLGSAAAAGPPRCLRPRGSAVNCFPSTARIWGRAVLLATLAVLLSTVLRVLAAGRAQVRDYRRAITCAQPGPGGRRLHRSAGSSRLPLSRPGPDAELAAAARRGPEPGCHPIIYLNYWTISGIIAHVVAPTSGG